MRFTILNKTQILSYTSKLLYIVISIRSPGFKPVKLNCDNKRLGALFLEFSDVDEGHLKFVNNPEVEQNYNIVPFSSIHAQTILIFFENYRNKVGEVVVNCEAGVSRSSAVGAALCKIVGQDNSEFFKKYLPNRYVYRSLLEVNIL